MNARGLFDVFEAARLGGVQRIVFATSNHTFGCYPITEPVSPALPPHPTACTACSRSGARPCCAITTSATASGRCRCASGRTARCRSTSARSPPGSPGDVARLVDVSLRHPDPAAWWSTATPTTPGSRPRSELGGARLSAEGQAEDHSEMLRGKEVDVDAPDRGEWEWPEHSGSFARAPERPVRD